MDCMSCFFNKIAGKIISEKKKKNLRKFRKGKTKMYLDIIIEFGNRKKKIKEEEN